MNTDSLFPKDAETAAELLAALALKDQNETVCKFPTCQNPRKPEAATGRPSAYCTNKDHNAVANHRARKALEQLVSGVVAEITNKREPLAGVVPVESLRGSVVQAMTQLQGSLERYVGTLVEIADPDIATAQLQAVQDRAEARIATAQQAVSSERSLRLAAESASDAARQEAQAEREAAELAIQHMEDAEAKAQRIQEEAERHIAEVQAERDETVERMQREAQQQIEATFQQARQEVAEAEGATATAQEQARLAEVRAHDAEVDARTRIDASEQLVREANTAVQRERGEVDRLRKELETTIAKFRTRAEAERVEAAAALAREREEVDHVRQELKTVTEHAREQAKADREELVQLRKDLATSQARADQLATLSDDLRRQLVEKQKPT